MAKDSMSIGDVTRRNRAVSNHVVTYHHFKISRRQFAKHLLISARTTRLSQHHDSLVVLALVNKRVDSSLPLAGSKRAHLNIAVYLPHFAQTLVDPPCWDKLGKEQTFVHGEVTLKPCRIIAHCAKRLFKQTENTLLLTSARTTRLSRCHDSLPSGSSAYQQMCGLEFASRRSKRVHLNITVYSKHFAWMWVWLPLLGWTGIRTDLCLQGSYS
jgi:hypothetical protein